MKLNLETIKEEIAAFTAYCAQLCFTLTWQVVLTGRIAYVGLPSNDDRRTYLDRFKKNGTTPQCVEQINYTYDTRILKDQRIPLKDRHSAVSEKKWYFCCFLQICFHAHNQAYLLLKTMFTPEQAVSDP